MGYVLLLGSVGVLAFIAADRAGKELAELSSGGHDVVASAMHKLLGDSVVVAGNQYNVDDLARQIKLAFVGLFDSPSGAVQMAERAVDLVPPGGPVPDHHVLLPARRHRFGQFALRFLDASSESRP